MSKAYEEFDHLETERLTLRPFTEADYPLILRISSDPQTTEYLYYWGRIGTTPESDARRFLDYAVKNWKKSPIRAREFCLVLKDTGEAIGDGSVEWVEGEPGTAEIGWILLPEYRGKGYATEAVKAFLPAMAQKLNIKEVYGICLAENTASVRVLEKCGFTQIYKGLGNYQGKENKIIKAIWKNYN
jgi:RimJ/RimL family protein N-acetyltransferase